MSETEPETAETVDEQRDPKLMPWMDHLRELRKRAFVVVAFFLVMLIVGFIIYPALLNFLKAPYCRANHGHCDLFITNPLDGLGTRLRVAAYFGAFATVPLFLFEAWRFIVPGLRARERRYALPFVLISSILFAAGVVLAYFTFEHALVFLDAVGGSSLQQIYQPNAYLKLILTMMLMFGIAFEFPVVLVALQLVGVVKSRKLLSFWRVAVIGIFVMAAVFTPSGDPLSMLLLAVPLTVFYFLAILVGRLLGK